VFDGRGRRQRYFTKARWISYPSEERSEKVGAGDTAMVWANVAPTGKLVCRCSLFARSLQMIKLTINGKAHQLDVAPDTPLLWVLRDTLRMTGTKYGCGQALCGACTVHIEGSPVRACMTPVSAVAGRKITTIEAIDSQRVGKAVQEAWRKLDVVQCGYCQSGQIMSAVALLSQNRKPTDVDIDNAMSGNLCRCATYVRIRAAIHEAAKALA
jgi:isoquinoline 1-oxidoreductase alpha subunit